MDTEKLSTALSAEPTSEERIPPVAPLREEQMPPTVNYAPWMDAVPPARDKDAVKNAVALMLIIFAALISFFYVRIGELIRAATLNLEDIIRDGEVNSTPFYVDVLVHSISLGIALTGFFIAPKKSIAVKYIGILGIAMIAVSIPLSFFTGNTIIQLTEGIFSYYIAVFVFSLMCAVPLVVFGITGFVKHRKKPSVLAASTVLACAAIYYLAMAFNSGSVLRVVLDALSEAGVR